MPTRQMIAKVSRSQSNPFGYQFHVVSPRPYDKQENGTEYYAKCSQRASSVRPSAP
jgi:hypothetical protein